MVCVRSSCFRNISQITYERRGNIYFYGIKSTASAVVLKKRELFVIIKMIVNLHKVMLLPFLESPESISATKLSHL